MVANTDSNMAERDHTHIKISMRSGNIGSSDAAQMWGTPSIL